MTSRRRVQRRREGRRPIVSPLAGPSHLGNGPRIVADELAFQASGKTLVKQGAHLRGSPEDSSSNPRPESCHATCHANGLPRGVPRGNCRSPVGADGLGQKPYLAVLLRNPKEMARQAGFEPATLGLEEPCVIPLSYGRERH